jgi:hypothetical protein
VSPAPLVPAVSGLNDRCNETKRSFIQIKVFQVMTPYSDVLGNKYFGGL